MTKVKDRLTRADEAVEVAKAAFLRHVGSGGRQKRGGVMRMETRGGHGPCGVAWWRPGQAMWKLPEKDKLCREGKRLYAEWWRLEGVATRLAERVADRLTRMGLADYDPEYTASVRELAADFERYRAAAGSGDPDAPPHRKDDPDVLRAMRGEMRTIHTRPGPNKPKS